MAERTHTEARARQLDSGGSSTRPAPERIELSDLRRVKVRVTVDLGSARMFVRDLLQLHKGSVLPMSKLAGELTDIYVNGLPLAKGEVVVIGDVLHVRVAEIIGTGELTDEGQSDT